MLTQTSGDEFDSGEIVTKLNRVVQRIRSRLMVSRIFLGVVVSFGLLLAGGGDAALSAGATLNAGSSTGTPVQTFTPVTVTAIGLRPQPVLATDGRYHLIYELELTNTKNVAATLRRVEVLGAGRIIASYAGKTLLGRLRTLAPQPAKSLVIKPDVSRLLFIELSFPSRGAVPLVLTHRFQLLGAADPGATRATPLVYTVARVPIKRASPPMLGPPLAGSGWVDLNGCCNAGITHRGSFQSLDGGLFDAQRFAIDWMRLNAKGELVNGNPRVNTNYPDYGAKVLAVANAKVAGTLDDLPDQEPGALPDPASFTTVESVGGNNVVLNLGHGVYALYAHLIMGSITVHRGQRVRRGQVLGELGNSGNTTAPHLHFQLMNAPADLASEGLPYVIDGYSVAGRMDRDPAEADSVTGIWAHEPLGAGRVETGRFPLNLDIVDFR
jgi:Peptidase family M23